MKTSYFLFKERVEGISTMISLLNVEVKATLYNNTTKNSLIFYISTEPDYSYYYHLGQHSTRLPNNYGMSKQLKIVYNYKVNTVEIRTVWSRTQGHKYILSKLKVMNFEPKKIFNLEWHSYPYILDYSFKMSKANINRISSLIMFFLEYHF